MVVPVTPNVPETLFNAIPSVALPVEVTLVKAATSGVPLMSIVGAVSTRNDTDFTKGVAITSSFFPDAKTHIEPVRYGKGSVESDVRMNGEMQGQKFEIHTHTKGTRLGPCRS